MSNKTIIAWTDHTFNGWWGCTRVSEGCRNCYAADLAARYQPGKKLWGVGGERRVFGEKHWSEPHKWQRLATDEGRRRRVFCGSMMDWAEDHPTAQALRPDLFRLMRATPDLDWQLLTKRPERIAQCLPTDWGDGWPNVWLGTSVEDMRVSARVDSLRVIPAAVRFISYEPALGPLDDLDLTGLDWVIFGGESGPRFRPANLDWARSMRDRCGSANIAFFFKQSAAIRTEMGTTLDGQTIQQYPSPRLARSELLTGTVPKSPQHIQGQVPATELFA